MSRWILALVLVCPGALAGQQTKTSKKPVDDVIQVPTDVQTSADAAAAAADAAVDVAPRSRWLTVYEDDRHTIYFDAQTVSRDGRNVTVWVRQKYMKSRLSSSGKSYIEDVARDTFYCDSRQISTDQLTARNSAGEVVVSEQLKSWEIERSSVVPETVGEVKYQAACEL